MAETPAEHKNLYTLAYVTAAALVGLVLGILIAWAFFIDKGTLSAVRDVEIPNLSFDGTSTADIRSATVRREPIETDHVVTTDALIVADQPAGMTVIIAHAALEEGQWVVIHEDKDGTLGNVLGAARFIGGAHDGAVELLRATIAGATYHAIVYADNGDRAFSLRDDTPLTDVSGTVKGVAFRAQ